MGLGSAILEEDVATAPERVVAGPWAWAETGVEVAAAGALLGAGWLMSRPGNVADTGIMGEARDLIAAGLAATICIALAILMDTASRARDTARMQRIKATQKAMGCRHSRQS